MAISIKHAFASLKGDGGDATLVRPSNWNEEHATSIAANNLVGRITAGAGAFEELPISTLVANALGQLSGPEFLTAIGVGGFQTGDIKYRFGTGSLPGFVRVNSLTIGSAASGATELADPSAESLFLYLWGIDPTAVVGGAGVSAAADWAANKKYTLPDFRGRVLAGMDTMGAPSAGRLTLAITGTSLGYGGGEEKHTLTAAEIPTITSRNPTQLISVASVQGGIPYNTINNSNTSVGGSYNGPYFPGSISIGTITSQANNDIRVTSDATGSGYHNNTQPTITVSMYMKL